MIIESTAAFTLFDYYRVPYQRIEAVDESRDVAELRFRGDTTSMCWPTARVLSSASDRRPGSYSIGQLRLFGAIAPDPQMRSWLRQRGGSWRELHELRDARGTLAGAVWQKDDGSIFLPFDPNDAIANYWLERYMSFSRPWVVNRLAGLARRSYYRARPLLPRALQLTMRRSFSRVQAKTRFPRWPTETALHDLYDFLFGLVLGVAQRPIPYIAPWPRRWSWAFVLTHDVETQLGYDRLATLLEIELAAGYRSSWNFIPLRGYAVSNELIGSLRDQGFEIGVHGLYHDGRDLESLATLRRRLPTIRSYAERWQADGFRSPATLRSAELMPLLGFDYDSSYPDTAPFEPQGGGCCSWLPYMIGDLVELPITLEQDHTLFEVMGQQDATLWLEKARFLRERGGMALIITHPDYVGNAAMLASYRGLLDAFADDATVWKALPSEVSAWWRRRAASTVRDLDGEWRVVGPAEGEARIAIADPVAPAV